jgi:hypothetical protein
VATVPGCVGGVCALVQDVNCVADKMAIAVVMSFLRFTGGPSSKGVAIFITHIF